MKLSRRTLLAAGLAPLASAGAEISVDGNRLRKRIEALSVHGRPANGGFQQGVSRVAYSEADLTGRKWLMGEMRAAGLEPRIDPAGNIFALRPGSDSSAKPLLFGSHIDTVPSGGNFDGVLGSLSALEALQTLHERGVRTRLPLAMVVWSNEEGYAFGRMVCGSTGSVTGFSPADLAESWNASRLEECLRRVGGDPSRTAAPWVRQGDYSGYFELHIEQGPKLERAGIPIGVVTGIVASVRHKVTITGFANHAGTTAMADRQDALVGAAQIVLAVHHKITGGPGNQVGTVGEIHNHPNAANVVPGLVRLTVELRDLEAGKVESMTRALEGEIAAIAKDTRTKILLERGRLRDGARATPRMMEVIAGRARGRGLRVQEIPSGAGHDAGPVSRVCPMGMIFVPSVAGISHSPEELTHWSDCVNGANVLLDSILDVAGLA